ncbi:GPW/gp25 family protein [Spongorhabdus nitratireducens]
MSDTQLIGRGWGFPVQFHAPGQSPVMVSGEDDVRQALYILLGTALGERAMRPDWGSPLADFMFAEMDAATLARLREQLASIIVSEEARIELHQITVDDSSAADGVLLIMLDYSHRITNTRDNMVYPFYLQENINL